MQQGFMTMPTTDLCDKYYEEIITGGTVRVLAPAFQVYGKRRSFSGPVTTLKVFEDNSLVRAALEQQGDGKVLVVDGGGSLRCALLGGNLAAMASTNGWAGILVNGCVRDVEEINAVEVGVRALAPHPLKSFKRGQGEKDVAVVFGGVRILPGEWCYSDIDGILIANKKL
ncbi:uncharacterized protein LOC9635473 [Selaginella moellendorffii]|nr:uncharacterized protein LOC9635473 [Selaginella moellendorffii]XP_024520786.1 uncharacterized protein LOC9635473 [Selaginella moellendorffii]|eukprot:XP_002991266.2 uncharacterized protein LOC9635473 [Selaginella moellendorffii]